MSTMARFDQIGALFSEDCRSPASMANRGFTIASAPTVIVSARGKPLTYYDGTNDSATWVGKIGTIKAISFWFLAKSNNEQFFDFDGGTHTIDSAVGEIRANGWTAPTIYIDGAATDNYTLNKLHHCLITSATGFEVSALKMGTDGTSFGAVGIADVVLLPNSVSAAEALLIAKDKLFRYDEYEVSRWDMSTVDPPDLGFKGSGNNGIGTGLVAATDIVAGPYNGMRAIEFNGTDELVSCGAGASVKFTTAFTISVLVKLNSIAAQNVIVTRWDASQQAYFLDVTDAGKIRIFVSSDGTTATAFKTSTPTYAIGKWYHICATYGASTLTIIVDGVEAAGTVTGAVPASIYAGTSQLRFGSHQNTGWLNGQLADVRIFDAALSPLQSMDLANRLKGGR